MRFPENAILRLEKTDAIIRCYVLNVIQFVLLRTNYRKMVLQMNENMASAYDLPNEDGLAYVLWSWAVPDGETSVYP